LLRRRQGYLCWWKVPFRSMAWLLGIGIRYPCVFAKHEYGSMLSKNGKIEPSKNKFVRQSWAMHHVCSVLHCFRHVVPERGFCQDVPSRTSSLQIACPSTLAHTEAALIPSLGRPDLAPFSAFPLSWLFLLATRTAVCSCATTWLWFPASKSVVKFQTCPIVQNTSAGFGVLAVLSVVLMLGHFRNGRHVPRRMWLRGYVLST